MQQNFTGNEFDEVASSSTSRVVEIADAAEPSAAAVTSAANENSTV